jgi:serine/threonine protein kinase
VGEGVDGRLVGGRYRLQRRLGRGGMGAVWAARDELLERDVAVKEVLPPSGLDDEKRAQLRERTLREARAAARINAVGAVTVFDVVEEDARPWIVMERLEPRTLADVIAERGRLPVGEVVAIGLAVLEALRAAHDAGVLHRDVKPGNVMVDSATGRVLLSDFGIAHLDGDSTLTSTGLIMGSPAYVSPERAQGQRATPASDLWSLGATLWAAVEGHPPFQREGALPTLTAVVSQDLPPMHHAGALAPVLEGLLRKDPTERVDAGTARELLRRAAASVASAPASAPVADPGPAPIPAADPALSPAPTAPAPGPPRHAPGRTVAAVAVLLVLAVAAVLVALQPWQGSDVEAGGRGTQEPQPALTSSAAGPPSSAPPTAEASQPAPSASPQPSQPAPSASPQPGQDAVPAGFERYTDETGFSVVVPQGWQPERDGPRVRLRDPGSSRYLLIDQTDTPAADPVADWERQEPGVAQRLENYERIRLEPAAYRGWDAADWEFVHGQSQRLHVLNRNVITSSDRAYALYWSVPDAEWDAQWGVFEQIAASFQPAP